MINNIREGKGEKMSRTDEQIKKDIVDELYWDARVDASKINVTVENGVVTLSGSVPVYRQLSIARIAAWTMQGVVDLIDNLEVSSVLSPPLPTDAELESRAANVLEWEALIDELSITVSVADGIAVLEGSVDAYWKKPYAENKVASIQGILGVENKLSVVPTKSISDELIADDVAAAFKRDTMVVPENITVEVKDGTVTLSGKALTWLERNAAEDDVLFTPGVIGIVNNIKIGLES